jgi:hypothetical protein
VKPFRLTAPGPTELELHKSVAKLLDWLLLPPAFFTTVPSGWGRLPKATAGQLYACGLKRGLPDLFVFHVQQVVGIELKVRDNKPTAAQREMHAKLHAVGIRVYVARDLEAVIGVLELEKIPHRRHWQGVIQHGTASDQGAAQGGAAESA